MAEDIETIEEISDEMVEEGKSMKDLLIEMKDLSEAVMDLAYSAVLVNSKALAESVMEMEEEMDKLRYEIEIKAMLSTRNREDAEDMVGIMHIAQAAQLVSDAASDIVDVVLRGEGDHPVLASLLQEADDVFVRVEISGDSMLADKTLNELKLATHTGMYVVTIQRGRRWYHRPGKTFRLKAGDVLLATGVKEGAKLLEGLSSGEIDDIN